MWKKRRTLRIACSCNAEAWERQSKKGSLATLLFLCLRLLDGLLLGGQFEDQGLRAIHGRAQANASPFGQLQHQAIGHNRTYTVGFGRFAINSDEGCACIWPCIQHTQQLKTAGSARRSHHLHRRYTQDS